MKLIVDEKRTPEIYITPEAKSKLDLYIRLCPDEISGLGKVERFDNVFLVRDIYLLQQEVTAGSTDLDPEAVAKFLLKAVQDGIDTVTLSLWWHSHVNMGTFWSGTDTATIERFQNEAMLSIVGNKKGEYLTRLDIYNPFRFHFDELTLTVYNAVDETLEEVIKHEIKEKVSKKFYVPTQTTAGGYKQVWDPNTGSYKWVPPGTQTEKLNVGKRAKRLHYSRTCGECMSFVAEKCLFKFQCGFKMAACKSFQPRIQVTQGLSTEKVKTYLCKTCGQETVFEDYCAECWGKMQETGTLGKKIRISSLPSTEELTECPYCHKEYNQETEVICPECHNMAVGLV